MQARPKAAPGPFDDARLWIIGQQKCYVDISVSGERRSYHFGIGAGA